VNLTWPAEAVDFGAAVRSSLLDLGGVAVARAAEVDPVVRAANLQPVLAAVGLTTLDVYGDDDESAAAMLAVRACGAVIAPWPVARTLAVPPELRPDVEALYLTGGSAGVLEHADLFTCAVAAPVTSLSAAAKIRPTGQRRRAPLDPFGTPVERIADAAPVGHDVLVMSFVLDAFWVLGALETVTSLAAQYAGTRKQFGTLIGKFGEIRWRLADMVVAKDGLAELSAYTWALQRRSVATGADAFALRVAMQDAASVVLRNGHQVFGAIGLCEEHDVAVIDRHLTAPLLRPVGTSASAELLLDAVNAEGFDAIFPVAPR
jgi:acyl-CoA dehydrogenase